MGGGGGRAFQLKRSMSSTTTPSVSVARALVVASALACPGTPGQGQIRPVSCGVFAADTRWLAESYRETDMYGVGSEEEWIISYGGLAARGDSVFFYDHLWPRIVHLSGELEERHAFGRGGKGPGEFHVSWPFRWLDDISEGFVAFGGRQVVVYDRLNLASFDTDGEFRWSARRPSPVPLSGVRFVSPVDESELIFGVDSLEVRSRRLQLWRVRRLDPNHQDLLWERPIPGRASDDDLVPQGGKRRARSYWARHRNCVVVSDGGSRLLWVVDLSTLKTDSIALPEWEIPAFGELPSDRQVLNIGGRDMQTPQEPALLSRWTGLIVDPDGHAWLRAWTESREEFQVFVVSLASGASRRLSPPGFPTAFGVPGVFYTARAKPETDEHQIVRFKAERQ